MDDRIRADNRKDVETFMKYREDILQNDPATLRVRRHEFRHLLSWAGDHPLFDAQAIEVPYPFYLLTARNDGKSVPLCASSMAKICTGARTFYEWAKREHPSKYQKIKENWIQSLRPRRANGMQSQLKKHEYWPLEDILKLSRLKLDRLADQRDQAAICFLYLSGMRITAFSTLSLDCVDIARRRIEQLPEKGVITKNHKAAITTLLPIPELLAVIETWDKYVRSRLPAGCIWYTRLSDPSPSTGEEPRLITTDSTPIGRRNALYEGLHRLCKMADIPYRSPHKLRHGHAVYGIKHARDMKELKAVSQNLMHSSISITDGIYGNMTSDDVSSAIANLGNSPAQPQQPTGDMSALLQVLAKLQANPNLLQTIMAA
jgi:integrase